MMHRFASSLALLGAAISVCALQAPAALASRDRSLQVTVAPGPDEVSLVQIAFPHAGSAHLSPSTLELTPPRVFGSDYLAVAVLGPGLREARALALIANRPSPLLDPARVVLTVRSRRALGAPALRSVENVLSVPSGAARPRLCDLELHGLALAGKRLSPLGASGMPLKGLGGAEAVAQAYDIACGLPSPETLRTSLSEPITGCTPCDPRPGFACPLTEASEAICADPLNAAQRAAVGANH